MSATTKKIEAKRAELAPVISNFLFHTPEGPKEEQKEYVELKITIRDYLKDKQFRRVVSEVLFDLQKDVSGSTRERLFKLYQELGLHEDAYKKLNSWQWHKIAKGILQLSKMNVKDAYHIIKRFVNDRRSVVRKQAELATVSLRTEGIEYVLDSTRFAISEWQQLKLIEVLGNKEGYRPPEFKDWLISSNKDVVLFALRLIKHYNQIGAEAAITTLVKHKNDTIKAAAVNCIIDFNFHSALPTMKRVFWKSNNDVKIAILNAFAEMGTPSDLFFLEDVSKNEKNFLVASKAQSAMNRIQPDAVLPSKDLIDVEEVPVVESSTKEDTELDFLSLLDIAVIYEEVLPAEQASIEFSEVEVYDVVTVTEETVESYYENHLNPEKGLDAANAHTMSTQEKMDIYIHMTQEERINLLLELKESSNPQDIKFLEFIAEKEDHSEIRYKAFRILQGLEKNENQHVNGGVDTPAVTETNETDYTAVDYDTIYKPEDSVFYPLFNYGDRTGKVVLVKEAGKIGTDKEVVFLNHLLETETDKVLLTAVKEALDRLQPKPSDTGKDESETVNLDSIRNLEVVVDVETLDECNSEEKEEADQRLPLELLFLNESLEDENPNQEEEIEQLFSFEIAPEYFKDDYNKLVS